MRARRIRARREDIKIALKKRFIHVGSIRLYHAESAGGGVSVAVIPVGVKKAVERNKIKRIVREVVWPLLLSPKGAHYKGVFVFMVTTKVINKFSTELGDQLGELLGNFLLNN